MISKEKRSVRIEQLTRDLSTHFSVSETTGEAEMGEVIYTMLAAIPYFQAHPENLRRLPIEGDPWERMSILALLRGEKKPSTKTIVTIGHFDTVGISDYGALAPYANQPDILREKLRGLDLPDKAQADLESEDYLFGRGVFDMKSGDAVLIQLLEELGAQVQEWEGNILFGAVCDEECNSRGMLRLVPELERMQREDGLDFLALLDTDCMTAEYDGDPNRYIYTGTVGKIMPTFYIVGKETHAGEAFKGLDPNLLAAEIVRKIDMNPTFCDVTGDEATLPPVSLQLRDRKAEYSTQIAKSTVVFFNYTTHYSEPNDILSRMVGAANECFEEVVTLLNQHYQSFCARIKRSFVPLPWQPRVMTYQELYDAVRAEQGNALDTMIQEKCTEWLADPSLDTCTRTTRLVEFIHDLWSDQNPAIIVYFTPPYYPHTHATGASEKERRLLSAVECVIEQNNDGYPMKRRDFFPCISDLSYAAAPDNPGAFSAVSQNTPGFGTLYKLPLAELSKLKIPVSMIGTYGHDAHKYTERLEKKYSFEIMPSILRGVINTLLDDGKSNQITLQ